DRLREGSETSASGEGEAAGPWELRHEEGVYPLFRSWEGFEHGDSPEGVFQVREAGLIFFAVRPAESAQAKPKAKLYDRFGCIQADAHHKFVTDPGRPGDLGR
ncbi:MAG TPA: hypothetical protein VNW71_09145, partial [Thermoanaerobaculia bacterium]|nr:hypothetical protein [Thermoanaerobaculia bacterium]